MKTVYLFLVLSFLVSGASSWAQAEEADPASVVGAATPPPVTDSGSAVTDVRLRAEAGSRSKYSLKFSLSYYGPPVGDLSNERQPNPDGSIGNYQTSLGGSLSARYRFDSQRALSLGTGLSAITPFHGVKRFDVRTPYVSYDRTFRYEAWQFRYSPGLSWTTIPEYRDVGQVAGVSFDASVLRDLNHRLSLSLDSSLSSFVYEREYEARDGRAGRYHLGFYPGAKLTLTDRLRLSTSVAVSFWNPRALTDASILWNRTVSQRLGAEFALRKDIFMAPYLNFFPENPDVRSTTVNVSTIFALL